MFMNFLLMYIFSVNIIVYHKGYFDNHLYDNDYDYDYHENKGQKTKNKN
jgi:hypothetical protein